MKQQLKIPKKFDYIYNQKSQKDSNIIIKRDRKKYYSTEPRVEVEIEED